LSLCDLMATSDGSWYFPHNQRAEREGVTTHSVDRYL
jgi:hypothetical protein